MKSITSYDLLETLARERLSDSFFMRDFLYSEIAAWHGLRNTPDHPDKALAVGRNLCEQLLEPLQATFGRIHIRSAYRSPDVNRFGNENKLNCASNEANYAHHIWDYPDTNGKSGATACIVIPWLVDHIAKGGSWTDMAWWIHDHLPYNTMYFFPKLAAFNLNWHEAPIRRIDSYASPKGCLTRPGMDNHAGLHADQYLGFPMLGNRGKFMNALKDVEGSAREASPVNRQDSEPPAAVIATTVSSGQINYRAIHTRNLWRKVGSHKTLDAAINGKDGAAALFARKVRISYETHGEPLYVLVWQSGAQGGYVTKADPSAQNGIRQAIVPMVDLLNFDVCGQASQRALEQYF